MSRAPRLGVVGWPVGHSRSPAMQNAGLRAVGLPDWRYQLLPVPPELFDETVRALPGAGFRGVNVTIPHKQAALALAGVASRRARAIGAANTLVFGADGEIAADNTDAPALLGALPFAARGRRAVVLGAGGSARAAVWALRDAGAEVYVWNRTPERAHRLAAELGATAVSAVPAADLLVNCTSIGLDGNPSKTLDKSPSNRLDANVDAFKQLPLEADAIHGYECVVDYVYGDRETALAQAARRRSVAVVDGLELLVGQGALSFTQFTGRPAPVEAMRAALDRP